jgi:hypothetical protein
MNIPFYFKNEKTFISKPQEQKYNYKDIADVIFSQKKDCLQILIQQLKQTFCENSCNKFVCLSLITTYFDCCYHLHQSFYRQNKIDTLSGKFLNDFLKPIIDPEFLNLYILDEDEQIFEVDAKFLLSLVFLFLLHHTKCHCITNIQFFVEILLTNIHIDSSKRLSYSDMLKKF